jgi:hypothetical protein
MNDEADVVPSALRALPQARHLDAERMATWWQAARALAATDAFGSSLTPAQQLRRLAGFGASEIGILVGEQRGLYSPFSTAREVVARKLLLDPPTPANPHQRRGILLEPLIRETFLRQSGAVRQPAWTQRIATHRPARWPWMQATPDDVVELAGRRVLVDYKAPAEPLTEVSLPYACQLHQTGLIAADLGYAVDARVLVAWNHPRGTPEVLVCAHDPALEAEIVAVGTHYWNEHVLPGVLPPWPTRAPLALELADLSLAAKADIEALAERWLRLELLAKETQRLHEDAHAQLLARCRAHHLADTVHRGPVQIKPRAQWNEDAVDARLSDADRQRFTRPQWDTAQLVALVRERGGDPDVARTDDAALDLDAAARWLITERGIPETALQRIEYQTRLSRRQADQPFVAPIREAARAASHTFGAPPLPTTPHPPSPC